MALPLTVPDVVCLLDLDPFARETTSDLQTLAQDVFHILLEPPGNNIDVPDRGIGIEQLLSGTLASLQQAANRIDHELPKDDRIDACSTTITQDPDGTYQLHIEIQVDATVVGLDFSFAAASGLSMVGWSPIG